MVILDGRELGLFWEQARTATSLGNWKIWAREFLPRSDFEPSLRGFRGSDGFFWALTVYVPTSRKLLCIVVT